MIVTNGTRVAYWDKELGGAPVFCTLKGAVVAVCSSLDDATEVVEKGLHQAQRTLEEGIRNGTVREASVTPDKRHAINEYRRKVGMKFPKAVIF